MKTVKLPTILLVLCLLISFIGFSAFQTNTFGSFSGELPNNAALVEQNANVFFFIGSATAYSNNGMQVSTNGNTSILHGTVHFHEHVTGDQVMTVRNFGCSTRLGYTDNSRATIFPDGTVRFSCVYNGNN